MRKTLVLASLLLASIGFAPQVNQPVMPPEPASLSRMQRQTQAIMERGSVKTDSAAATAALTSEQKAKAVAALQTSGSSVFDRPGVKVLLGVLTLLFAGGVLYLLKRYADRVAPKPTPPRQIRW